MKDASSEQRLLERVHALDVRFSRWESRMEALSDRLDEMHKDVKGLLGFRASLLGWAAGVSAVVSLVIALVGRWIRT